MQTGKGKRRLSEVNNYIFKLSTAERCLKIYKSTGVIIFQKL